jgi:ProP effector
LVTKNSKALIVKKNKNTVKINKEKSDSKLETKKHDVNKFKTVKSSVKKHTKTTSLPLRPVESATIKLGDNVVVQLGNSPMKAMITEISGNDISVQLDSGMIIKTQLENIYSK